MSRISRILAPECVRCDVSATSRKRTLQALGDIFANADSALTAQGVFDLLVARERLGSTSLGDGCALPHARVPGLGRTLAAFLRLGQGVDFDAPDHRPVDLVFGLLVPEESTDEHLETLATIAGVFADDRLRASVRSEEDPARIREILAGDRNFD